jgi:hypothetical protein
MEKVGGGFRTVFGMGKPMDQGEVDIQEVGVGVLAPSGSNDATIANTGQITSMASSGAQAGGTGLLSSVLTETPEDEVISVLPDPGLIAASTVIREELNAATSSASPKAFQKVVAKTTALGTALKLAAVQIPGLRNIGGLQTQVLSIIEVSVATVDLMVCLLLNHCVASQLEQGSSRELPKPL